MPKLSFDVWKGLRCCHGPLLMWVELSGQALTDCRAPQQEIQVCFCFLFHLYLSLTSSRPRGIIGPTITRSGDGLVVPSRSLHRHVATVSGTLPSPRSNLQAHPNHLPGTTGLSVPPRGHPSDITISTTPPDGGKPPAPPWQGRPREGLVSRLMHKAWGKFIKTST